MDYMKSGVNVYNWVLVGSTGSGKSSTANCLAGENKFEVSDGIASCTASCAETEVVYPMFAPHKVKLIDTVGFGDSKMSEDNVFTVLREFTSKVIDIDSTCQIDAFLLVTGTTPRFATIKDDMERLVGLFGTSVLKSTLIVVIDTLNRGHTDEAVLKLFKSAETAAVSERIAELKGIPSVDENCFIVWDNMNPRPDQFKRLVTKIQQLKPYTHKEFQKAKEEMKEKYDRMASAIEKRIKREYEGQFKLIEEKMAQEMGILQAKFEKELNERQKAEDVIRTMKETFEIKFAELNQEMQESKISAAEADKRMKEYYEEQMSNLRNSSSQNNQQFLELMQKMQADNAQALTDLCSKIQQPQIVYVPQESDGGGGFCSIF